MKFHWICPVIEREVSAMFLWINKNLPKEENRHTKSTFHMPLHTTEPVYNVQNMVRISATQSIKGSLTNILICIGTASFSGDRVKKKRRSYFSCYSTVELLLRPGPSGHPSLQCHLPSRLLALEPSASYATPLQPALQPYSLLVTVETPPLVAAARTRCPHPPKLRENEILQNSQRNLYI